MLTVLASVFVIISYTMVGCYILQPRASYANLRSLQYVRNPQDASFLAPGFILTKCKLPNKSPAIAESDSSFVESIFELHDGSVRTALV